MPLIGPWQCSNINFLTPVLAFHTIYYFLNIVLPFFFSAFLPLSLQPIRISFLPSFLKTKCILSVTFLSKSGLFHLSSVVYQPFYHWQCKVKSQSLSCIRHFAASMDCNLPSSSIHRIFHARILEWVAISFSRVSSQPWDQSWVTCIAGRFFTV